MKNDPLLLLAKGVLGILGSIMLFLTIASLIYLATLPLCPQMGCP